MTDSKSRLPESQRAPSGVPKKSGGGLVLLGVLLLLLAAGGVAFKVLQSSEAVPEPTSSPVPVEEKKPVQEILNAAPPPPPPPEDEQEKKEPEEQKKTTSGKGSGGCAGECQGKETSALLSTLRSTATQARTCYNRALRVNEGLEGKMTARVRVSPKGAACGVSIVGDTLGDAGVKSCVSQMFATASYPAPTGGCVEVAVPLNFVAKP